MKFDITDFAGRNQPPAAQDIDELAAEILDLKAQAGNAILDIGRKLIAAKELVPHGEWGDWLRDKVEFSERTAQNFMRLAREWSNPHAVADLGARKALMLLALPSEEREEFIEANHVVDMSSRELEDALKQAKLEAEAAKATAASAEESRQKMEIDMQVLRDLHKATFEDLEAKKEALTKAEVALSEAEIALTKERQKPVQVAVEVDEKAVEAARKEAKAEMQAKVDQAKAKFRDAEAARDQVTKQLEDLQRRLDEAEVQSKAESNQDLLQFNMVFQDTQAKVNQLRGVLLKIQGKDATLATRLRQAILALSEAVKEAAAL